MKITKWILLIFINFAFIGILGNKYYFMNDVPQLIQFYKDGVKTNGVIVGVNQTRCSIGTTHLRCTQPIVEFYTKTGEKVIFKDIRDHLKNNSYVLHKTVNVYYSESNPDNARAYIGNDFATDTIWGGIWFFFITAITLFLDHTALYGYKGLLTKPNNKLKIKSF